MKIFFGTSYGHLELLQLKLGHNSVLKLPFAKSGPGSNHSPILAPAPALTFHQFWLWSRLLRVRVWFQNPALCFTWICCIGFSNSILKLLQKLVGAFSFIGKSLKMLCLFSYWSKTRTILYTIYDLFIHVIYQDYMPLITKLFTNVNTECKNVKQFYDWLLDNLWYNIIKYIYIFYVQSLFIYMHIHDILSPVLYIQGVQEKLRFSYNSMQPIIYLHALKQLIL